jgi:hypothetical protein
MVIPIDTYKSKPDTLKVIKIPKMSSESEAEEVLSFVKDFLGPTISVNLHNPRLNCWCMTLKASSCDKTGFLQSESFLCKRDDDPDNFVIYPKEQLLTYYYSKIEKSKGIEW